MRASLIGVVAAALSCCALFGCGRGNVNTEQPVTLSFVGDILLDSAPGQSIARGADPFAPTRKLFEGVELSIGNLECPVATSGAAVDKVYTFRASPSTLPLLHQHFDAVSVANNHSGDYGPEAFRQTLSELKAAQVRYFGGGSDLAEAHAPLMLEKRGLKIALLGYDDFHPRAFEASPSSPGVAWAEDEQVILDIARARAAGANVVLPFLHWGWENEPAPCARQRELARTLIDAGADAVIGSHPHVTQGAEMYRGKPIIYSLGNFVFDLLDQPENAKAWVLRLSLDHAGVARFSTAAVHLDEQGTPAPDPSTETPCGVRGAKQVTPCAHTSAASASPSAPSVPKLETVSITDMPESERGGTAVVLLHGFGAQGDDLVSLAHDLARPRSRFFMPAGPLRRGASGRAWWHIDPDAYASGDEAPAGYAQHPDVLEARKAIQALLRDVQTRYSPQRLVLAGFSQGAMLSFDVALAADPPVDRVAALSGVLLVESLEGLHAPRSQRPSVFISHGRADPVLPFHGAEGAQELLTRHGFAVTFHPFEGVHEIPPEVVQALSTFIFAD